MRRCASAPSRPNCSHKSPSTTALTEVRGSEGAVFVAKTGRRFYAQVHLEVGAEIGFVFARKRDESAERAAESGVDNDAGTAGL